MSDGSSDDEKKEKHVRLKNPADVTALKISKLMARIDKPIVLPESRRNQEPRAPKPVDFVRNIQGSSAGAGSGEFHVYRNLRRKEYARLKQMDIKDRKEREAREYQERMEAARQAEEMKTAKRRDKRRKRGRKRGTGAGDAQSGGEEEEEDHQDGAGKDGSGVASEDGDGEARAKVPRIANSEGDEH
ncbi:hypothetical protein HDU83_001737 [Entophlyctis luteolus]|nr:hypothetical protein HDU83_001737 [Entophlyctis luteolus]